MSNLGFQTVYRLFNELEDMVCERVFLPPKQELRRSWRRARRCVTLESQTPVRDFDVLAFSVSFEWDYTNVVTMLRLAGVPAARRGAHDAPSARRDWRRGDVRQPRAAGARSPTSSPPARAKSLDPVADRARSAAATIATTCCAGSPRERGFYIPSFYESAYAANGTIAALRAARRHRRAARS